MAVTFDDGYGNILSLARRLLESYDVRGTVFLTTSVLEDNRWYWWDELASIISTPAADLDLRLAAMRLTLGADQAGVSAADAGRLARQLWSKLFSVTPEKRDRALDEIAKWAGRNRTPPPVGYHIAASEVPDLADDPLVEVGSHSLSHPFLPNLSHEEQEREISDSKAYLEVLTSRQVMSFAYPFGAHDRASLDLVAGSGYTSASIVEGDVLRNRSGRFALPRVHMSDCDGDEFMRRVRTIGLVPRPRKARRFR